MSRTLEGYDQRSQSAFCRDICRSADLFEDLRPVPASHTALRLDARARLSVLAPVSSAQPLSEFSNKPQETVAIAGPCYSLENPFADRFKRDRLLNVINRLLTVSNSLFLPHQISFVEIELTLINCSFNGFFTIYTLCIHLCPPTEKLSSKQTVDGLILPHRSMFH